MAERILAVIPARSGSKGIPNKNIRLLGGHPLIFYAIRNAIQSARISDILVTTDSREIEVIAAQMNAPFIRRRPELCGDDVTLDSVVYDAMRHVSCDFVVTMQPTSPLLTVATLDAAIDRCIEGGYDTILSVINHPHLSWHEEAGSIVPSYAERLNRQYLPANYIETGAFVIAKSTVVTPISRLGSKIGVFEVPEAEALDIDSFMDLRNAETALTREKVAFYVNGNTHRGVGHVYRVLELADEFYTKPVIYFDKNQTDRAIFGETTHNILPVNGIGDLFDIARKEQYTVFINDILETSIDYMIALRQALPHGKLVNFEDDGEGGSRADIVINALYDRDDHSNVVCGERYYVAPKLFMFYNPIPIREKVQSVFIGFGGADPQNYTDRLMDIIEKDKYKHLNFTVVLGRAKHNIDALMARQAGNIKVLFDIKNMPEVMSSCDIGVTSRGRTGYELSMLGIPSIAMAQNKGEEKHGFVSEANGFSYLGLNPDNATIEAVLDDYVVMPAKERARLQAKLTSHDLRNGRQRVMALINNL